jgi:integrase
MDTKLAFDYWMDELSLKSEGTRASYLSHFNMFIKRYEITPEELFRMQKEALASTDPREGKRVTMMVKAFMKERLDSGKAAGTARGVVKAVKSFFDANGLEFTIKAKDQPIRIYNGQRVILPNQIREFYENVGAEFKYRNQALIMLAKDSGLRASDISLINVGDYIHAREVKNEAGERFKVFRPLKTKKKGLYAHIHLGPEAIRAVDRYLEERRREEGELSLDSPIFIQRGGGRATAHSISAQLKRLSVFLGSEGYKISGHSLRKFHKTRLEAKMNEGWINKLQGKAASEYSHPEETEDLTAAYIKAYDMLSIFTSEAKEDAKRDRRIKELEAQLGRYKDIEERMNQMQQQHDRSISEINEGLAFFKQFMPGVEEIRVIPHMKLEYNGVEVDPDKLGQYLRTHRGQGRIPPEDLQRLKVKKKDEE